MVTRGKVRRAKLYYLRELKGKKARIKERREAYAELVPAEEEPTIETEAEEEPTIETPADETPAEA